MGDQLVDMLEAVQRPQVARLQARVDELEAELADLRAACVVETDQDAPDAYVCVLCLEAAASRDGVEHADDCPLRRSSLP